MISLVQPPDDRDTSREQIEQARMGESQVASLGLSGGMFVPADFARGLVTCPDCQDTYLNAEYLKTHDCPA